MIKLSALVFAAACGALPALAEGQSAPNFGVELLPGWRKADGTHMAALRITLDDGWKTYWRAPGEAGIPPVFDWSDSTNLAGLRLHWPVPEVFSSNGMTTLGYHHELVLPIEVTAEDPAADIRLDGTLALGICNDICMPMQAEVSAVLPGNVLGEDPRIASALLERPDTRAEAGLVSADCTITPIADGLRVTAAFDLPPVGEVEFAVFEPADRTIWVSEAIIRRDANMLTAVADLVPPDAHPFALDTETLRFTLLADGRAVDILGCDEDR